MISYPGDIVCRFGRYEAVEDLGASGSAHLWGAWDPYLERFVIVVALSEIEPRAFLEGMRDIAVALEHWTAGKLGADDLVLDCSPGTDGGAAFLVVAIAEAEGDTAQELVEARHPALGDEAETSRPDLGDASDSDTSPVERKRR